MSMLGVAGGGIDTIGAGMQMIANSEDQRAINRARQNANQQQGLLQGQANQITQGNITSATRANANKQIQAGAATRNATTDALRTATSPINSALPSSGAGSARTAAASSAWGNLVGNNAAQAGGYGDWEQNQSIKNAQASQKPGILGNFAQGNASLLPVKVAVAGQAGNELSGWGNIVSMIGNTVGGAAALNQYNKPQTGDPNAYGPGDQPAGW